jgi:hypothetical protein
MVNVIFAAVSFFFPGGGQLLHGQLWAALGWLIIGILLPGIGNIGSAIHALLGGDK